MTTLTAPRPHIQRQSKPLQPVTPAVELLGYSRGLGLGLIRIDGTTYGLFAHRTHGRTDGIRLVKEEADADGVHAIYDVDFCAGRWSCDCPDATYRPGRPGGCKHAVALRAAADAIRAGA